MIDQHSTSILIPAPTAWPFIAALGVTLVFAGLVTHAAVSVVGAAVLLRAAVGWWSTVLPEQQEEVVAVSVDDRLGMSVPKSLATVDHLFVGQGGHRARLPLEVHPVSTGLYGGAAGAVAMAAVAMLFGLISQRSIWYPINLLGAGILSSLAAAPIEQLREFSWAGLIAGSVIHGITSLLVGLLYAITLPMFPQGASWRSGLVSPVLWSGLVAGTLSLINPTLNARIEWGWFVASQIAFGLTAGCVVAHTARIETMQSWPLAERAGIETPRKQPGVEGEPRI
jgi:hypothetical protein